jgi:hypothetical protein
MGEGTIPIGKLVASSRLLGIPWMSSDTGDIQAEGRNKGLQIGPRHQVLSLLAGNRFGRTQERLLERFPSCPHQSSL